MARQKLTGQTFYSVGEIIGHTNREAVRAFFTTHVGCTQAEAAKALGLSPMAVNRHVATLRKEWKS